MVPFRFTARRISAALLIASLSIAPTPCQAAPAFVARVENQAEPGSGFFLRLANQLFFVTARHVVGGSGEPIVIQLQDGRRLTIPLGQQMLLREIDVAMIPIREGTVTLQPGQAHTGTPASGDHLTVWGYPVSGASIGGALESREGRYLGRPSMVKDGYSFLYSAPTQIGFSGGPILDRSGAIVAMHGRAESHVDSAGVRQRTGNALGIPITAVLASAAGRSPGGGNGIDLGKLQEQSAAVAFEKAVEILQRNSMSNQVLSELDKVAGSRIPSYCVGAARAYYYAYFSTVPDLARSLQSLSAKTDVRSTPAIYYAFGALLARKMGDFNSTIALERLAEQRGGASLLQYSERRIRQDLISLLRGCAGS